MEESACALGQNWFCDGKEMGQFSKRGNSVLEDEQVGKISQVEQKSWNLVKREEFMTFGRRGRQLRRTARMS